MRYFSSLHPKYQTVLWMMAWAFSFSTAMLLTKKVGCHIPMTLIVWGRCAFSLLFFLPFLKFQRLSYLWGLQLARGICVSLAMICTYTAYRHIDVHTVSILGSTGPFFITLFSLVFLKERMSPLQWGVLLMGYAGVLVILGPAHGEINLYYLVALLGSFFAGLSVIFSRVLAMRQALAQNTLFYSTCTPFLIYSVAALFDMNPLSGSDWALLMLIGGCGGMSAWCYFQSLKISQASFVAPLEYLKLCVLIPMGYIFFAEVPLPSFYLGSFLVVLSSFLLVKTRKNQPPSH